MRRALLLLGLGTAVSTPAAAQTVIAYDDVQADTQAVITCGFCATEKYGSVFYELPGGGGLTAASFPLTLNAIQIAVASTQVTGDILSGYQCGGTTAGGQVNAILEVYAGGQVPATITTLPATGAWPGEVVIVPPGSVQLERSPDTAPGANMFNVMINSLQVGANVPASNTYLRVVVTIPSGGTSASCTDLGFQAPALSPFRDDNGRVGPRRGFIYQLGLPAPFNTPSQWTWIEDVTDPITMQRGINGDWLIRLDITPNGVTPGDAGVEEDGGPMVVDTGVHDGGVTPEDAGFPDTGVDPADAGTGPADAPTISDISPDSVLQGSAASVTVVGTGFQMGLSLKVGAISADVKLLGGSTTIVADVPMGIAAGTYDVVVTNPDGQSAILAEGFEVKAPPTTGPPLDRESCRAVTFEGSGAVWALLLGVIALRRRRR